MQCLVCPMKMTYDVVKYMNKACGSCQRHIRQMVAGFHGVILEARPQRVLWDNSVAYEDWESKLDPHDRDVVHLNKKGEYVNQRCDIRDMKRIVGLPKFLPLEDQVFTAWIMEGTKDERMQEVLGLTYSQLFQVKKVIKNKLQKQMAYYKQIQKLEKEGKA